jgi:hypothetical protein
MHDWLSLPAGLLAPGWIGDGDLEKYNPIGIRDVMVRQFLDRLLAVFDNVFKCRMSRDGTETTMMPPMKQAAILTPSGRSMMFIDGGRQGDRREKQHERSRHRGGT